MKRQNQPISFNSKKTEFVEYKAKNFKQISETPGGVFNFIFQNNDIFKMISSEDYQNYLDQFGKMTVINNFTFVSAIAGVIFTDKFLIKRFAPGAVIPGPRLLVNLFKFVGLPFLITGIASEFTGKELKQTAFQLQQKYAFGYSEYLQAINIFERALAVNRLEELLEKRADFDWTDVPQLSEAEAAKK